MSVIKSIYRNLRVIITVLELIDVAEKKELIDVKILLFVLELPS